MKLRASRNINLHFALIVGLGGSTTIIDLSAAQEWVATSAPVGRHWRSLASSADGIKLFAAGVRAVDYDGFGPLPIYISADSGVNWTPSATPKSFYWSAVACSADGNKVVAVQGGNPFNPPTDFNPGPIFISSDSGMSWSLAAAPSNTWASVASSADGTKLVAVGDGGVYTSRDSGVTWLQSTTLGGSMWSAVASSADGTRLVVVSGQGLFNEPIDQELIYTSADSGTTWSLTTAPTNSWSSVACSADGARMIASAGGAEPRCCPSPPGPVYTSSDFGATWRQTGLPYDAWTAVASSADGSRLVATSSSGALYESVNSGAAWTTNSLPMLHESFALASSADGTKLIAAGTRIFTSAYYGPWRQTCAPLTNWSAVASSADGVRLAAASGNSIYTSANLGAIWRRTTSPARGLMSLASSADGTKLVVADGADKGSIYSSMDSGTTWTQTSAPGNMWVAVSSSADGTKLVAAASDSLLNSSAEAVYVSSDSGLTWHKASAPTTNWWTGVASSADGTKLVAVSGGSAFFNTNLLFASTQIYLSTDSGSRWVQAVAPANGWQAVASSSDGVKLIAVAQWVVDPSYSSDGLIYTSTNSGATWTAATSVPQNWISVASSADGSKIVATTCCSGEIFISSDSGATWAKVSIPGDSSSVYVASSASGDRLVAVVSWSAFGNAGPIYTLQLPLPPLPSPPLSFGHSGDSLNLSWLIPSSRFGVQQNSDLTTMSWSDATNAPTLNYTNLHYEVVVPQLPGSHFYRLKQR